MKTSLIVVLCIALALLLVNVVVDPFYRFDLVSIAGFNAQRGQIAYAGRMAKAERVCALRPEQVIIGGSRVEVGFDPNNLAWNDYPLPVYNLGLAGMGLHELSLTFQHVVNTSPLKRAVIGLDFIQFNQMRENVVFNTEVIDFDPDRLVLGPWDSCLKSLAYDADSLLGPRGLKYSYRTVTGQHDDSAGYWANLFDADGARSHFWRAFTSSAGAFAGHIQEEYYVERIWRPAPLHRYCLTNRIGDEFRQMLEFARQHNVDLRLYIEPMHARMMLAIHDAGLWEQYERWQKYLTLYAGIYDYPLWDFSGFNAITTDEQWWWEPSHYKRETGDLMLGFLLDSRGFVQRRDFGTRLTPDSIELWQEWQRSKTDQYRHDNPEIAKGVGEAVAAIMAKTPSTGACP